MESRTGHFVGEKLTMCNALCGMETPYTVVRVGQNTLTVRRCKTLWYRPHYFDDCNPDLIEEDPNGAVLKLRWNERWETYIESPAGRHPRYARFGQWGYCPNLD